MHAVVRRLQRDRAGPGVLVCNDFVEMLLVSLVDPGRTVVQILHGDYDYYYDPRRRTSRSCTRSSPTAGRGDTLLKRLPHRADTIFLPYGFLAANPPARSGALRLIFAGRLDEAKGVSSSGNRSPLHEASVPVI
jgi:hypothetical protein